MGDKSPKAIGKNKKQKDGDKVKAEKKAKDEKDAKAVNAFKPKK
jgi:hypothetical protein